MTRNRRFQRITIGENRRRVELLNQFSRLMGQHQSQLTPPRGYGDGGPQETEASLETRQQMNLILDEVARVMLQAGIRAEIRWTPPPMFGGYVQDIPLIPNYFNLHRYQIGPLMVLDHVVRAVGIYEADAPAAQRRTFNPFFWLGIALDTLAGSPFALLRRSGFNTSKVEDSLAGRLIRLVVWLLGAAVLFLTLLQLTGFLDSFLQVFGIQMRERLPTLPGSQ